MVRKLFSLVALVLVAASCANDIDKAECVRMQADAEDDVVFYAAIEGSEDASGTKVFADSKTRVLWNADDRISIFNKTAENQQYRFTGADGANAGHFEFVSGSKSQTKFDHVYALYPYSEATAISAEGVISLSLPAEQAYKADSFGLKANTMISVTGDNQLKFRNVGSYLSFRFYGDNVLVKRITLQGNNHEKIAGAAKVTMGLNGTPTVEMLDEATEAVTLNCGQAVTLGTDKDNATEFWFVLPPTDFTKGITVTVVDENDSVFEMNSAAHLVFERNKLTRLSAKKVAPADPLQLEREALIAFYNATNGENWTDNTNWCSDKPVAEWFGVTVQTVAGTGHEHVVRLEMPMNNLTGTLPKEMTQLAKLSSIRLENNKLSGKIPSEFLNWRPWSTFWYHFIKGNRLNMSEAMPYVPDFDVTLLDGSHYTDEQVRGNSLTILYQWGARCPHSPLVIPALKSAFSQYHASGLEIISWANDDEEAVGDFLSTYQLPWPTFLSDTDNCIGEPLFPYDTTPFLTFYDDSGQLVSYMSGALEPSAITTFVDKWFGGGPYESTDYSADGQVHLLQTATEGAGINVVLMGDAFSDRMIADGTYEGIMRKAAGAFFSEEPYKSFRELFNVYYVDVVSKNEIYDGETALDTYYGTGTEVGGNDDKVKEYALNILSESQMDDALIIVMMNRDYYAGTCWMYYPSDSDYGRGLSIAYFPTSSNTATFNGLVSHEAGGHGFAKLADEYEYGGTIPNYRKNENVWLQGYGWLKNIDFTSEPADVLWARFIADARYDNERIGVYQGGDTYLYGVWRPTENSIMNNNTGGFNAPSREAIWYRLHKLAHGPQWVYDYEDFVAYDVVNRTSASQAPPRNYVTRPRPPHTPPVIIPHDWREGMEHVLKNK